jgi:hypothetical protein
MRNDPLTLMQCLTNAAAQLEQGTPTAAPGWAPSAVWLLLRKNARASRKVRV